MRACRCGISDWRAVREALGLNKREMGKLMKVKPRQIYNHERADGRHDCPSDASLALLQGWLQEPEYRRKITAAGISLPW